MSNYGIEADYDAEQMPMDEAVEIATNADLSCIIYTSPSHTEAKPRWRVLCPFTEPMDPYNRQAMLGRLNGLYGGIFSGESWTLSQSYYYGSVNRNPAHQVAVVDGQPIDELHDLDRVWRGKPDTKPASGHNDTPRMGALDEAALLAAIASGDDYHQASVRLLGKWAMAGVPLMDARQRLIDTFEKVPDADRDARWEKRHADVGRCVGDIYGKEAKQKDDGKRRPREPDAARDDLADLVDPATLQVAAQPG